VFFSQTALKSLSGQATPTARADADVNKDGRIGHAEAALSGER
jgi:hypothetical protein